ncbi:MAG: helix-turn-helix domain-containing protein [Alphaproteobacteria bacterium]
MEYDNTFKKVFLRTKEAAAYLNLTPQTLERLRSRGGSPIFAKLGRIVIYDIADLQAWVDSKKQPSTFEPPENSAPTPH